jgi:amino acid adenylation domain-containing protein/non-ribosomal peptide synthase protein (TIGR01720 family)
LNEIASRLAALSPAKRALLQKLQQSAAAAETKDSGDGWKKQPIPRRPEGVDPPLSFAQQRLWFLDRLEGPGATYNMPNAVRLDGPLDLPAFESVFREIVRRHESLRTNFAERDGVPVQIIRAEAGQPIPVADLQSLPEPDRQAELARLAEQEARRPFDLARDRLLRLSLVRLGPQRHVLLINVHHIVSDGWSNGNVLLREVLALYQAFVEGKPSPLPPLPIQYADFACWQREWLDGPRLDGQLAYWREQLAGMPALLHLPTDRPRPPVQTFAGSVHYFTINAGLAERLKALGQHAGATLFMVLLSGFAALLSRYSRQDTVAVGTALANRRRPELEPLIGFFVNTLVLRNEFGDNPTGNALLARTRQTCLDAYRHQDVPFERLVEAVKPERNLSFSTLFQAMFILQNQNDSTAGLRVGDLRMSMIPQQAAISMFDLTLKLEETGCGLSGELEYNTDLFDESTIARFAARYRSLLDGLAADPGRPVAELPLLDEAERRQILTEWNGTQRDYPSGQTAHGLFEQQAALHPHRVALCWEGRQVTYARLDEQAGRLAGYLRGLGAGQETLVGLCVERSIDMVVGLLGILKAGAAYVPLDPIYPKERLGSMLASSGLKLLLVEAATANVLPECDARLVYLDRDAGAIAKTAAVRSVPAHPDSLAYVIYTSGSTGVPKGVQVSHACLLNFLLSMAEQPGLGADETLLAVTTISFDIAGLELYLPLIQGGRVALASRETAADGFALLDAIHATGATAMQATPATWLLLFATGQGAPLRRVFCGGEALASDLAGELLATGAEVWNLYGPTETTIWSTAGRVASHPGMRMAAESIGRPIANTQILILDAHFQPVPAGLPGELYIGGAGVARGYRGQPGMTAERFLPNPFAEQAAGSRIYRTGDLALWRADGTLEFLGRVDHQVKLRGFRIELGEIEAALSRHPAVRNAVAVLREDQPGHPQLVAYVEADPNTPGGDRDAELDAVQIDKWQAVWDETYRGAAQAAVDGFDTSGWLSSYTGQPIPEAEMRAWVDLTVARILGMKPSRILEIGCGTGLLLSRVAPRVDSYVGVDFSATVLERLGRRVREQGLAGVRLVRRDAAAFLPEDKRAYDLVVINSVIQYFPGVDYLLAVLEGAVDAVADGGHIFLGDLRSLPLLALQHASVQFHRAAPSCTREALAQRVSGMVEREEELLLDPRFFKALGARLPRVTGADLLLKRGTDANEMVKFRYDAVLWIGTEPPPLPQAGTGDTVASLDGLREALAGQPDDLVVRGLPNARLVDVARVLDWLRGAPGPDTVGAMRAHLRDEPGSGIDPEALWALAESLGYAAALNGSEQAPERCFDAVFQRAGSGGIFPRPASPASPAPGGSLEHYTNQPVRGARTKALAADLRRLLEARLPAYMVPTAIVCLDRLPLTPNGKTDRRALPAPDASGNQAGYLAPRTAAEEGLAAIWAEVLGAERIGINDNFFALGGHSLLAVQVISKIRAEFAVELPIQALFDAPTVALLAERLAATSAGARPVLPPIQALPPTERATSPLSFAQQRLWFLDRLEGAAVTYHISGAMRISGPLNVPALEQAFSEIVRRHEALRTRFAEQDGGPVQIVAPPAPFRFRVAALDGLPEDARRREIRQWLATESELPFALDRDLLLRATLLRTGAAEHLLLVTLHHIISDEWSVGLLLQEVAELYRAFGRGQPSPLPELPVQYADYARWQRQWLTGAALKTRLDYWIAHLEGAPEVLDLPTDRPRPQVQRYRGQTLPFAIDARLTAGIRQLAQSAEATLFMALLGGFGALLGRYARTDDLVVGIPIANRDRAELERLIGFFVNTLPLRLDLSGNPRVCELLARVRGTALAAYENKDSPFEHIVERLKPERSLSHAPLFQVMFVLQNAPAPDTVVEDLRLEMLDPETVAAKFDLTLSLEEVGDGLRGIVEYNTDLFDAATIQRFIGHYQRLLAGMATRPQARILDLPLLGDDERRRILRDWNRVPQPAPAGGPVLAHRLFEEQAEIHSDRIALAQGGASLSYGALNFLANQIAHRLLGLGIGPDMPVGLCAEPSFEMIAGILGILKAGGAYVPLLPDTPPERLDFILAETGAALVLTQTALAGVLPGDGVRALSFADLLAEPAPGNNPKLAIQFGNLAYIVYTSGSTGRPKGVEVSHGNLARSTLARREYYDAPLSGLLLLQPFGFDIATGCIFWTLAEGGCLYLEPRDLAQDPQRLIERIAATRVSHLTLLPLLYAPLLELALPEQLAALRVVVVGGEQMPAGLAARHAAAAPGAGLFNEYGPTETTVWSSVFRVDAKDRRTPVPIGRPTARTRFYILDGRQNLVPVGVPGELYIGGEQLSRGYRSQAAMTADYFVPDPFGEPFDTSGGGARLYRTGDIARYRDDGNVEFLGRLDSQVKIRGFRIELGEIEAVLKEHPAVATAAVVADEQGAAKRLVAYVVPGDQWLAANGQAIGHGASSSLANDHLELTTFLKSRLPDYMVPSACVLLRALPLTANGKLDKRALPTPEREGREEEYQPPRTPTETLLADIWQAVLGVERVGIADNFFALGGDSILSIQIVSRANRAGLGLTVKQLFQHQTVGELARAAPERPKVQAEQGTLQGICPLTPVQLWFFEGQPTQPYHFNQSVLLKVLAGLDAGRLERAIHALVMHHDMLRARFHWEEGRTEAAKAEIAESNGAIPFIVRDLSELPDEDKAAALSADAGRMQASLDLAAGPLLRVALYRMGADQPDRLLFIIHHLVVDGVSWRILLGDLDTAMAQMERGEPVALPPKTTSFPCWAGRLREYAGSARALAELGYWREQAATPVARLPLDHPACADANTLDSADHVTLALPEELTRAVLQEVPEVYRTQINDILLSALARTFAAWTRGAVSNGDRPRLETEPALRIVMEGHGREELFDEVDLSRTVGWFTAGFPLVLHGAPLDASGDEHPAATLKRVKETLRGIPGRGLGFGVLRYLSPDPETRAALGPGTEAEISFNYLGRFDRQSGDSVLLGEASEPTGPDQAQAGRRRFLLEINAILSEGQLRVTWTYSIRLHRRVTVERLAAGFFAELETLVRHCREVGAGGYTVSDFPLAKADGPTLDRLFQHFGKAVEDAYPLSPMQQGMLFHSLYDDGSGAYVMQMACKMGGGFQPWAFRQAWQRVLDRHPSLRVGVLSENGADPLQVVLNRVALPWQELDWRGLADRGEKFDEFLRDDRTRGFAMDQAPLMRCALIRLEDDAWQFAWSHHHLLTDGWCLPILMREVLHFYNAFLQGREAGLPSPPPYRDYIAWLGRQDLAQAEAFWRDNLRGFGAPTALGVDRPPGPAGRAAGYRECSQELDADTSQALQQFAQTRRLTLGVLVQGAWAALLSRYSGASDVLFGATVSGRPAEIADVDSMVGLFINTLPVRAMLDPGRPLADFLAGLRDGQLARDAYTHTPLVSIHNWSEVPAREPLFESIVVFENYPMDASLEDQAGALAIRDLTLLEQTNFPLTLTVAAGTRMPLRLAYDTARFDGPAAARMLCHLANLLAGLAADPSTPQEGLTVGTWCDRFLLADWERRHLLEDCNQTRVVHPDLGKTLPELFEAQVRRGPDRVALVCGGRQFSYARLNREANRIAHRLRALGVGAGVLVAVCLERSPELVAALLGIQKAGGAYLPLDPTYPADRLAFMLEDGKVETIVTHTALRETLPDTGARWLCVDEDAAAAPSAANPACASGPDDPAYVIHTSGSTGRPKGVLVTQRALVNFLLSMAQTPGMVEDDRLLAVTTIAFDIAGLELYLPLLTGARLALASREAAADGAGLLAEMDRAGASVMQATPATWRMLLEAGWRGAPLRRALCGGEGFPQDLAARMADTGVEVFNLYGPTETTVWSSVHPLVDGVGEEAYLPIGRPVANTRLYVVDRRCQPVPQGVPGELLIGGDGLARGYLGRPGLTAEKFTPDPFGAEPGSRLYHTGDLARHREDGSLACLGRIDHQVKIRGFRIEPGEIEAQLERLPEVAQALVAVWEAGPDDRRLVAYVVPGGLWLAASESASASPDTRQPPLATSLREALRQTLPEYMLPSEWVFLDAFPLTRNGKIDRRALPEPNRRPRPAARAPRTPTEARLATLMAEVLSVERVGADEDFFELGGHSLLAAKLVSRIGRSFGFALPLPVLFQSPTVEGLAEHVETTLWATRQGAAPAAEAHEDEEEFRL